MNILVPLAVTATSAAWRGAHGAGCAARRGTARYSAAVVFSALITLLAAAGVALPVLRCVPCTACTAMRARRTAVLVGRGH